MNRGFWFVAGAGAGIYASVRVRRVAEAFTSDGISDRIAALQLGGRLLREDVSAAAVEKEAEIRVQLGLDTQRSALHSSNNNQALPPGHSQEKEVS